MVEIAKLTADRDAMRDGEWVAVGLGEDQFEIKTRGYTPAYRDGLNRLRRQAARDLNRKTRPGEMMFSPENLTPSVDDQCQGQALADFCILDVRGLTSKGVAVTAEEFRNLLRQPEGLQGILVLAIGAAARVGQDLKDEREQAEGNSSLASDTTSSGADNPTS